MTIMLPQEVAEKLSIIEYTKLCEKVENKYHQKFGVVDVERHNFGTVVVVELDDHTQYRVKLG